MNNSRPVYSSETGRVTPPPPGGTNRKPGYVKPSAPSKPALPDDGVVRIFREKGGRGGKTVTVVRGLPDKGAALEARAQELKRLCGAGGTLRDGAVEVQGDHRERIAEKLTALGYRVKLAGG
ncbi:MAG: translation initiation factor [Dehalococcoidia bacterium]